MAKEHIYLGNDFADTISFTPISQPYTGKPLPSRDVAQHASMLRKMYRESIISAREKIFASKDTNLPSADVGFSLSHTLLRRENKSIFKTFPILYDLGGKLR